ncbi:MAG: diaminopimelate dehydrogenase [Campylobacter sp.]|nr:diaminopimelate dehydrogenase [Campylobacter sp.]
MQKIKIGIVGYGNLGSGVIEALKFASDMELVGIFSRRELDKNEIGYPCYKIDNLKEFQGKIDVMILCGGSATDLPEQTPKIAQYFSTIDSFDTHAKIPEYFKAVDEVASKNGNVSIISVGWDPGLFSINRLLSEAILPNGKTYTFWGKGLSQGHSDAVRRVEGVLKGVQYTIPDENIIKEIRDGKTPEVTGYTAHKRECFIVAKDGADKSKIESEIKNMPNYFKEYETTVNFISLDEFERDHTAMPHGGFVIRGGTTGKNTNQVYEFNLKLGSNPEFTSSVLVAYARAAYRMKLAGYKGAKSVFDVAPALTSPKSKEELLKELL